MNRIFRTLWSVATQSWQAVPETAKTAGKKSKSSAGGVVASVALSFSVSGGVSAQSPPAINQLPTGGTVARGIATISQTATAQAAAMTVNQSSQRAVINWDTFNLGSKASVNFVQPNAQAVTLNRVNDSNPSQIFGRITANGQVFLTNANGVYFSPTSSVDVGAFTATTHSISDDNFMSGKYVFERNGATGKVINEGNITAALGGYVALLAPEVQNAGVVVARAGTVAMAAGDMITLKVDGVGSLAGITTTPSTIATLVENKLAVQAPDGQIILSAVALNKLQAGVVKNSGSLEANSLASKGGKIYLEGDNITLASTSKMEAKGPTGGGTVLVGGDWQGSGDMRQATKVTMQAGATIDASATDNGDGGKVVLWSDIHNADSVTLVNGSIKTEAGPNGGNGGQIETSGHNLNVNGIQVSAQSINGTDGIWLLDPYDVTISSGAPVTDTLSAGVYNPSGNTSNIQASALQTALGTSNVQVSTTGAGTQSGNISILSDLTWSGVRSLTLNAAGSISGSGNITPGTGSVVFTQVGNSTYSGNILGASAGLQKQGAGTLSLTGSNTYGGATIVGAGVLQIGNGGTSGSIGAGSVTLLTGANLSFNRSDNLVISNSISGAGGVSQIGSGTTTLTTSTTFTGGLTINAGTLQLGNGGSVLTMSGAITGSGTGTFAVNFNTNSTLSNIISGSVGLTQSGSATLTVNGTNTYTGKTSVLNGTLKPNNVSAFGTNSSIYLADTSGVTLDLNNVYLNSVGAINGGGSNGGNIILGARTLTFGANNEDGNYAGSISGTGSLIKSGSGTQILSGSSSYSGTTTVSTGVVTLGGAGSGGNTPLGSSTSGTIISSGATLDLNGYGLAKPLSLSGGTLINSNNGAVTYSGNIGAYGGTIKADFGAINLNTMSGTSSITLDGATGGSFSGDIGLSTGLKPSSLIKKGSGTWVLNGANIWTPTPGSTPFDVQAGTLKLGSSLSGLNVSGTVNIANGATLEVVSNSDLTLSTTLTGSGAILKSGGSTSTLTLGASLGSPSFSGPITVSSGLIAAGYASQANVPYSYLGTGNITVLSGGALDVSSKPISNNITINGTGVNGGGAIVNKNTANTSSATLSGILTIGSDSLITTGSGNSGINFSNTASISNNNYSLTLGGAASGTLSGAFTGSGSLTKVGAGTWTLSSNTSNYTGETYINQGTLAVTTANALGSTSGGTTVTSGATLALNFPIGTSSAAATITENIQLSGPGVFNGTTYVGALTTGNASTVNVTGTVALDGTALIVANTGKTLNITQPIQDSSYDLAKQNTVNLASQPLSVGATGAVKNNYAFVKLNTTASIVYGDTPNISYALYTTATGNTLVSGITATGSPLYAGMATGAPVGTYQLTYSSGLTSGYALFGAAATTLSVVARPITLEAGLVQKFYGSADPALIANVAAGSIAPADTLMDVTGTLTRAAGDNVGSYNIALGAGTKSSNYTITFNSNNSAFSINPKPITITNNVSSTTYDATSTYAALVANAGYTTNTALVGSDAIGSVTQTLTNGNGPVTATDKAQAGTFTSTPSAAVLSTGTASNYSFTYAPATNTVAKANLAIAATPSLTGNVYNGSAYTGTYTTNALGNDASGITVTGVATGTNAGTYTSALVASGGVLSNYNTPTITNANLVIDPKPIAITNNVSSTTYDAATTYAALVASAGYTTNTALVGSDAIGSVTQTLTNGNGLVTATDKAQAGSFTSTPSAAVLSTGTASNYSFTYAPATNTVAKANLAISATPSLMGNVYNGSAYTGTYTSNALGNDASGITVTGVATGTNAGTYTSALAASGGVLSNYNTPAITNANLVIDPKSIALTGQMNFSGQPTLDTTQTGTTLSATNLVQGDSVRINGTATLAAASAGTQAMTAFNGLSLSNGNYTTTGASGSVTVIPTSGINVTTLNNIDVKTLIGSQLAGLTGNQVASLSASQLQVFSGQQLGRLSASQLSGLTATQLSGLSGAQLQGISPAQLSLMTPTQLGGLTPSQLAGLTTLQLQALTATQVSSITPAQLSQLSPAQIAMLTGNSATPLSFQQVFSLVPAQIAAMSPAQVARMTATEVGSLSDAQLQSLTSAQIAAIAPNNLSAIGAEQLSTLSAAQLVSFSTEQLAGLTPIQIASLAPAQIEGFSQTQLAAIGIYPKQVPVMSADTQVAAAPQPVAAPESSNTLQAILQPTPQATSLPITNVVKKQEPASNYEAPIPVMTAVAAVAPQIAGMSGLQIRSLTPEQLNALPKDQVASLNPAQVQALTTTQLSQLTPEQAGNLSKQQISVMSRTQLQAFSPQAKAELPTQTGVLAVTFLQGTEATPVSKGVAFAQSVDVIELKTTTAPVMPTVADRVVFNDNLTTFLVATSNGGLVEFQGGLVNNRMIIIATSSTAKSVVRDETNLVLAAAVTSLGKDNRIVLAQIEGVIIDLR